MDKWLANEQNDDRWDQALAQTTATLYGVVSPTKEQIWNIIDGELNEHSERAAQG